MSPSLKKLCVYGLAAGLGSLVLSRLHQLDYTQEEKELMAWNANQIIIAGERAITGCNVVADNAKIKQAEKKITEACMVDSKFNIILQQWRDTKNGYNEHRV